jgi:hypothetical protein
MAIKKKKKKILPELDILLQDKLHKVSTISFHYGNHEKTEQDDVFKMSFYVEIEEVPKSVGHMHLSFSFRTCLQVLRTNGNAPMADYIQRVMDDLGDVECLEYETFQALLEEGFQFDKFIEGVIFSVAINCTNVVLEPEEEGVDW